MNIEGLENEELEAYKYLLSLRRGTVLELAKISGQKRTNLYRYLESLISKGMVSEVYEGKKHLYIAEPPDNLIRFINNQKDKLEEVLPELREMEKTALERPKIKFFEGLEGIRTLYDELLKERQEILAFAWPEKLLEAVKFHDQELVEKRVKYNIGARVIYPDTPLAHRRKTPLKEARYSKNIASFESVFMLSGNKVVLFSLKRWITGVLIDNREIADGLRAFFDAFWEELGKSK